MKTKYLSKFISMSDLMVAHKPVEVEGYCSNCEKYGQYWTCPPFENHPIEVISKYSHVLLIAKHMTFNEAVNIIETFENERQGFGVQLDELKDIVDESLTLVGGNCYGCKVCSKNRGLACVKPENMRYSLEALGFLVSDLTKLHLNKDLCLKNKETTRTLMTVGALLYNDDESNSQRLKLDGILMKF